MDVSLRIESFLISVLITSDWLWYLGLFFILVFFVAGLRIAFLFRNHDSWITWAIRLFGGFIPVGVSGIALAIVLLVFNSWNINILTMGNVIVASSGLLTGVALAFFTGRRFEPFVTEFLQNKTIRAGRKDFLTDIRDVSGNFPDSPIIDLDLQFASAKENDSIFLGMGTDNKPVTIDRSKWKQSHVQIMGPPGAGKGAQAAVTLTQSLEYGDAVYVIDPKNDEWAPSVFRAACERVRVPFYYINLNEPVPQLNPLFNASSKEIAEMFYAGLALGQRGESADYYRLDDRKAARLTASLVGNEPLTIAQICSKAKMSIDDGELMTGAKAFFAALEEVGELLCLQTPEGIDLSAPLRGGGCAYITGSMRNEPIMILQKMLFIRLVQIVERTVNRTRHCSIFLDEFKYLLSAPALNVLGTIRDKGCNILLAHQSLGDFAHCGVDLTASSVRATILDNTAIRWLYRSSDSETASWISDQTGKILIGTQRFVTTRNPELAESLSQSRSVGEAERNQFDVNTIQSLSNGCAVCIGSGIPQIAMASAIPVTKTENRPKAFPFAADPGIDVITRLSERPYEDIIIEPQLTSILEGEPRDRLLRFLYYETWTHFDVICELLEDLSKDRVRRLLKRMEESKAIKCDEVSPGYGATLKIWGITRHGIDAVQFAEGVSGNRPIFSKAKVKLIDHYFAIQRMRLFAEHNGWVWIHYSRKQSAKKGDTYPDALAIRPDGTRIGIEVERTVKQSNRYPGILVSHLEARRLRHWDEIYYLCPTTSIAERLKTIFENIETVNYHGEKLRIKAAHLAPFKFYSYQDDWTKLDFSNDSHTEGTNFGNNYDN